MRLTKLLSVLGIVVSISAGPALAGNASMNGTDGSKLKIKCQNSGCVVRQKKPNQKWAIVEKGPGGTKNFKKLHQKYKDAGFK